MSDPHKRLHTLLTDRAITGLSPRGEDELQYLLAGGVADPSYERAAAAIELALHDHGEELPEYIEASVMVQAARYYGFAEASPHERTVGRPDSEDSEDFFADDEDAAADRGWEESPGLQSAIDSGVLESSLTDGRIEEDTNLEESNPGDAPPIPDLDELEPTGRATKHGPKKQSKKQNKQQSKQQKPKKRGKKKTKKTPKAKPKPPEPDFGSLLDSVDDEEDLSAPFDPQSVSQSDLAPVPEVSAVRNIPLGESRVVRWATYISAAAALLMLSVSLWLFTHRDDPPDPASMRAQVEASSDVIEWAFDTKDHEQVTKDASGSVVWSSELQAGVMVINGLGVNDPKDLQYQLWIVDKRREGPPVDGGVFNVDAEGEVEIPIDAKLVIGEPGAFVITVERPGGVVVSEGEERIAMVAG